MQELRECMTDAITRHTMALHDVLKQVCIRNRSVDLYKLLSCFSTEAFTDTSNQLQLDIKEVDMTVLSIVQQVLANRAMCPEDGRSKNTSMLSLFLDIIAKSLIRD
ncbi:Hypothetical protein PHPALM_20647 [Phytophthora palmivora]|uniref:Uncharacterized protein n=1 Tax=Phytophthora palmivora TaxID=4796 RepID=A0A2P4XEC4_9STRA|nr:Hypothetical protein PHPALM_20647 [Phytophthora palmivora]